VSWSETTRHLRGYRRLATGAQVRPAVSDQPREAPIATTHIISGAFIVSRAEVLDHADLPARAG